MRVLPPLLVLLVLLLALPVAGDEIALRGNYWRDRNTRVLAPEIELSKELPTGTIVGAGYMLDAITSASAAAGALTDEPFTELRNDVRLSVGQRIGPATLSARYRYSTESDYWAHSVGGTATVDLLQKNLTLAASYSYGRDEVGRRTGPTGVISVGHIDSHFASLGATQILSRFALLDLTYEYVRLGDRKDTRSFLGNPYRTVIVAGTPQVEVVPRERNRHTAALGLRLAVPQRMGLLGHLVFAPKYRLYVDDWGVIAHTPELRTYVQIGPVDLRFTGRYHTQRGADFFRQNARLRAEYSNDSLDRDGQAAPVIDGVPWTPEGRKVFAGDAKLSSFSSYYFELRVGFPLRFLDFKGMPLGRWLGDGTAAVTYGHYVNDRFAHVQFGDADVGALDFTFPL